jgi:integrase
MSVSLSVPGRVYRVDPLHRTPFVVRSATRLLEDGRDVRTVQEVLGHGDASTTKSDAHVLNRSGHGPEPSRSDVRTVRTR